MLKKTMLFVTSILMTTSCLMAQEIAIPDGYAGDAGTTGGGDASPITVTTASEFKSAIVSNNAAVIIVNGRLDVGAVSISSNKTIVGANSESGLFGGMIRVQGDNYIFQNLTMGPSDEDVMEVSGATKVFITKCSFYDSKDELLSIVREADFVTISWCKFYFDNKTSHSFAHLIGNSDSRTTDRGKLHVTMHHNWYAQKIVERMPRVRFGHVHIYNNYYNSVGNNYCIGTGFECHIRLENTYFENVRQLWRDWNGVSSGGVMGWDNLKLVDASEPTYIENTYPAFSVPYQYEMDPVDDVKDIVTENAGNVFTITSVDENAQVRSSKFKLLQNFPNPFNPSTTIEFSCPEKSRVNIEVFDLAGRKVALLLDEVREAGNHSVQFDGANLSTGIYMYKLSTESDVFMRKMLLVK